MLISAKPKLEKDIKSAIKDAFREAYMTQFTNQGSGPIDSYMQKQFTEAAEKFAEKASTVIMRPLAQAIYDFVKEIGITTQSGTLISGGPGSPVTGIVPPNLHIIQ